MRIRDIIAGLKAGHTYARLLDLNPSSGPIEGTDWLIPTGSGPDYSLVLHVCETTQGEHAERREGTEEIDGISEIIGSARSWRRLS